MIQILMIVIIILRIMTADIVIQKQMIVNVNVKTQKTQLNLKHGFKYREKKYFVYANEPLASAPLPLPALSDFH